ncbi:MAG: mechanosensitive ion channel, partial [Bacteroidales bacterium]|nr:mechanosensitive ion channel [Bacteroidales bacterium]
NYVILPNSELTKNTLTNWTYDNVYSRFRIDVGVDYSSDAKLVEKLLIEAVQDQVEVLKDRPIFARFQNFGASSLDFSIYFWSEEIFKIEQVKQDIRIRILELFRKNNISIPFPQRDVNIKNQQNNQ